MRVTLRVRPGASRNRVGGSVELPTDAGRGAASGPNHALGVAVTAPAVDGRATDAVLQAVARAVGVRRREVLLVSGATSRTKVVEVPDSCAARITELLDA